MENVAFYYARFPWDFGESEKCHEGVIAELSVSACNRDYLILLIFCFLASRNAWGIARERKAL
jgi:hypothetical protein